VNFDRLQRLGKPEAVTPRLNGVGVILPLFAGGALAAYNPPLAIGISDLTVVVAAAYKSVGNSGLWE
jgi:hypothetical protein